MVGPPLFYRLVLNPLRQWAERDERLLVEHWKATLAPTPKAKVAYINLLVRRDTRTRQVA